MINEPTKKKKEKKRKKKKSSASHSLSLTHPPPNFPSLSHSLHTIHLKIILLQQQLFSMLSIQTIPLLSLITTNPTQITPTPKTTRFYSLFIILFYFVFNMLAIFFVCTFFARPTTTIINSTQSLYTFMQPPNLTNSSNLLPLKI